MDIDMTRPSPGRIYDYLLGGHHNFAADAAAAERLLTLIPSVKSGARLNRWFMFDAMQRLAESGYDCYLDLATGLPTQGYVHDFVPHARVLYNDIDPVTVAYGREIVGANPNVRYVQANFIDIDSILHAADEHFGGQRRIGICFIGATYFVDEANLRHILGRLYDWCAPGSRLALSWAVADPVAFQQTQVAEMYRRMNSAPYLYTIDTIRSLIASWRIEPPGLITLSEWLDLDDWRAGEAVDEIAFEPYGVIVARE